MLTHVVVVLLLSFLSDGSDLFVGVRQGLALDLRELRRARRGLLVRDVGRHLVVAEG